jgi:TRAP-type mannitol/chloroaromatic compound transport system permease small subunit
VGTLLFLIPFCLVVIYGAYKYTLVSFNYNESSPDAGGLPARYLIKAVIPIGFLFLLFQSFAFGLRAYLTIKQAS